MSTEEVLQYISRAVRDMPEMVDIFNWIAISKLPLPAAFISEHYRRLNWDVMCSHQ